MDWSSVVIVAPVIALILIGVFEAGGWYYKLKHVQEFGHPALRSEVAFVAIVPHKRPHHFWRFKMAQDIVQGDSFAYDVVCTTARGKVVAPKATPTVAVSPDTLGAASATGFKAAVDQVGPGTLVATADGVASAPFEINVVADDVVATVAIVPKA